MASFVNIDQDDFEIDIDKHVKFVYINLVNRA